jgi:hypothetical protein
LFFDEIRKLDAAVGAGATARNERSIGPRPPAKAKKRAGAPDRVAGAVKGVRKGAARLAATTGAAFTSPKFLLVVGFLTLASALLGLLVLYRAWRENLVR